MYPSGVGYDIENMVANEWRASAQEAQHEALAPLPADLAATGAIGDGPDWRKALDALDWLPGEPMLVGSSHRGAIARILLGADFEPDHPQCAGAGHRAAARRRAGRGHLTPRKPAIREGRPP